ncbi:unnamed protein product, partial [Brassica oleracea var. botrytis]
CSGYHVCLTRKRSPVRSRSAPVIFAFSHICNAIKKRKHVIDSRLIKKFNNLLVRQTENKL